MDEENQQSIFSDFEKRQLSQDYFFSHLHEENDKIQEHFNNDLTLKSLQPSFDDQSKANEFSGTYIKAFNPFQMVQKMAPQKQKEYLRMANHFKNFNGLQFVFQTQQQNILPQKDLTFLSGINQGVFTFDHQAQTKQLQNLFQTNHPHQNQKLHIKNMIAQLRQKMSESQQKCFGSIMINKTIGSAFYEHFQNFSFVSNPSNFFQDLQISLTNFINHAKKIKGPGPQLISNIYDFWIKTFKDFVNEIWKYSEKYTLSFLKKQKNSQISDRSDSTIRKQSLKEKRKNWNSEEIRILQKIIDSNVIFSQNKLKELSEQFGRSINSISSKIQKIIKSKKGQQYQEDSLLKKTIEVLKLEPLGLPKQSIIEKINQYYEMGYDGQWQKSVGQLLSSRKEFNKIKGKYKLLNGDKFVRNKMDEESYEKLTFRDKIIQCLLKFQNHQADLKSIIETYISIYGESEGVGSNNQQRRKVIYFIKQSIEGSISKTLSRYDIFDTSNSKTIYQLQMNCLQTNDRVRAHHNQFENYIDL